MRPRLPLCLLPFVGVLAFASSFSSNAANITISNGRLENNTGNQYYAYAFNGISNSDRDNWNISDKNTLLDKNNTFTFRVQNIDGTTFTIPGAGTYLTYENAITLYAGNNAAAYNGHDTPYIGLNNTNLTFTSEWKGTAPVNPSYTLTKDNYSFDPLTGQWIPWLEGGEGITNVTMPNQWTYFSSMGVQGTGDLTFNFQQNFHEIFIFSSKGSNDKGTVGNQIVARHLIFTDRADFVFVDKTETPILKPNAPFLDQEAGIVPADIKLQGNINVLGGNVIYLDAAGSFITGTKGLDPRYQSTITVKGKTSFLSIQEATEVDIYSRIFVTDSGAFYIDQVNTGLKSAKLHSGFTVSNYGQLYLGTDGFVVEANPNARAEVINGGKGYIAGSDFVFNGDLYVGGLAEGGAPVNTRAAKFSVLSGSRNGVFTGTVTVEMLATFALYGEGTTFEKEITVQNHGILILGGPGGNSVIAQKGIYLGENARVEASTNGNPIILDKPLDKGGKEQGLVFRKNGAFVIYRNDKDLAPGETGTSSFAGGFTTTAGHTVSIEAALSQASVISNRGDYAINGIIAGEGNINIRMANPQQTIVLGGKNTYTGSTTVSVGIFVLTNENTDGLGNILSGSAGQGSKPLIFDNTGATSSFFYTPAITLSSDFSGNNSTDEVKYLSKDMQIGSAWGNAAMSIIAGNYQTLSDNGDGSLTMRNFADNIVLQGKITSYGDTKGTYQLIKNGTGAVTLAGLGAGQGPQANFNGFTVLYQGKLVLGNKDGVASLVNDKTNTITYNGPGADFATLEIKKMNDSFNNDVNLLTKGRIDVIDWSDNLKTEVNLAGDIYNDRGYYSPNRVLEIFSTEKGEYIDQGVTLSGNIILEKGTIKYYGNQLTLTGGVTSDTEFILSGANNSYNDKEYGAADIRFVPKEDNTLFDAAVFGAKDLIKEGDKTLVLGSDLSSGAYSGNTYIKNGSLLMYKDGKLSQGGTVYLSQTKDQNGNVLATGTLNLGNTEQTISILVGNGILDTAVGILSATNGHTTELDSYFGGNIKGSGIFVFDKKGDNATFRLGNAVNNTAPETKSIDFSGIYAVKGGGILSAEEKSILSAKATMGLFDNSTLKLKSEAGVQSINALYSLKGNYETDLESAATILLGNQASLNVTMGLYSGLIVQEDSMDKFNPALQKTGAVNGEGEPLAVDARENTLVLVGNGSANQYNFNGEIRVGQMIDDNGVAGGTLILDGTNLSKTGPVVVTGNAKALKYDGGAVHSQVIIDLTNHNVTLQEITLQRGAGLKTTGGASGNTFNVQNMYLEGSSLIVEAALDSNHRASLQGFNVNGEVTISQSEKNYLDLDLAAGNWGYNADANNGSGNTMRVFKTDTDANLENLLVKKSKYVFLDQNREIVNNTEIYIDVTRNGVKFSDFINGSIGASLDHADSEYVSTNKLKGQASGTLGLVLDQMYVMTSKDQVAKAVQSLSGASNYVLPTAQLMDLRQHADTVRDRISRIGVIPGTNMTEEVYHGWAMGLTNATDIKSDGQVPGFKKDTWGGMVGFDTDVSNDLSWGMAFAYTSSDLDIDGGDSATTEAYYLDGFGRYQKDKWSVTGVATVGTTTSDTKRRMKIGEVDGIAKGSPNGYFLNALAEVGYDIDLPNNWIIQPLVNLNLGYLNVDSYSETGMGNAALSVDSTGQFIARLGAGVRSVYSFYEDAWSQKANLQLRAMILQDLTDVSPSVSQSLIGSVGSFDADGSGMGKTAFQLGAGVAVPVAFNLSVFANVDAEFRSDANSIGGNLGVRYTF